MNLKGTIQIAAGLAILIFVVRSISVLENWIGKGALWVMAIGYPTGGFLIFRGKEKLGL